jgi:hypothetical protein
MRRLKRRVVRMVLFIGLEWDFRMIEFGGGGRLAIRVGRVGIVILVRQVRQV